MAGEITHLPAAALRRLIGRRVLSAEELTRHCLEQVERYNGTYNAICTLNEGALDEARALDQIPLDERGPLHGLPVGIKDVTEVRGLRTTYGSTLYRDHVPAVDALVVERLRKAGAVILGKTNAPEFATGGNTFNEVFGATRNPWNPALSAGGSTGGGAAALASGMIALAEGTDLGGSLRIPASFCGVVGLRPSPGLVPTWPSNFLWDSYQVTGGMGRFAVDVALMLQAVSGPDPRSPMAQPDAGRDFVEAVEKCELRGKRLAYCRDIAGIGIDEPVESACRAAAFALRELGAEVEEIELDLSFARQPFLALRGLWMVVQQYRRLDRVVEFGPNLRGNVEAGLGVMTDALAAGEHCRRRLWEIFHDLFQRHDHLLTPCMAVPPFPVEENFPRTVGGQEMATYIDWVAPTFVLSMTGLPVASVPAGLDTSGLPAALQVVGQPRGEEGALVVAKGVQEVRPMTWPALQPG
jgi:amidase